MDTKAQLRHQLTEALTNIALAYLNNELLPQHAGMRRDFQDLHLGDEARRISATMAENILTTLDVHLRQLLFPEQQEQTEEWLRTQNYMHRREQPNNLPGSR
jgi:hypothetical protein